MEADFLRYYNIYLAEALFGNDRISMRLIFNLWKALPEDAAIRRLIDPAGALPSRWTTTEHLLATVSEQIDVLSSMFYSANTNKNAKKWKPLQHTRPELPNEFKPKPKKKRSATSSETLAILRGEL